MAEPDHSALEARAVEVLDALRARRTRFLNALSAPNTRRGYDYDMRAFEAWCLQMHLRPLPATADTLALYVTHRLESGCKVSTVARNAAAVAAVHKQAAVPSPYGDEVRSVLAGASRSRIEGVRQVRPIEIEDLRQMSRLLLLDDTPMAARDRAILLTGFASGLRSQNLSMLRWPEDVEFTEEGARLTIRREKQDQKGAGRFVGLPHGKHPETCVVRALRDWLARRGAWSGPVFVRFDGRDARSALQPERICAVVKSCLVRIGRNPARYGSHSMRSGLVTAAGEAGAHELLIAAHTGHRDLKTLKEYFRPQNAFKANVLELLDL